MNKGSSCDDLCIYNDHLGSTPLFARGDPSSPEVEGMDCKGCKGSIHFETFQERFSDLN